MMWLVSEPYQPSLSKRVFPVLETLRNISALQCPGDIISQLYSGLYLVFINDELHHAIPDEIHKRGIESVLPKYDGNDGNVIFVG